MTKRKPIIAAFAFIFALSLALLFGITVSGGGLTAYAEDNSSDGKTIIPLVEATVTVPVAGETIDTTATVNGEFYKLNKVEWYKGADVVAENKMNPFAKFAEGQQYTVAVKFYVNGAGSYRFDSEETLAKINGQSATTFSVGNAFISAKYTFSVEVPEYSVTLENGTLEGGGRSGMFEEGAEITITADAAPEGKVFYEWVVVSGDASIYNESSETTTVETGCDDVVIKAVYKTIVRLADLTLKMPVAGDLVDNNGLFYPLDKGYTATLTWKNEDWSELEEGAAFVLGTEYLAIIEVNASEEYIFTDETEAYLNGVEQFQFDSFPGSFGIRGFFPATEKAPVYFDVKVTGGRAEIDESALFKAESGTEITLIAKPAEGQVFEKWEVISGGVTLADETAISTTFVMGDGNVEIKAIYKEKPHEHNFGEWKEEIPATTEKDGVKAHKDCTVCHKHFDKDGNEIDDITIEKLPKEDEKESESEKETVSEKESAGTSEKESAGASDKESAGSGTGTEIKPTDTKPTENKGLSGGAIAGIVVGSVVVAGVGGFSIFWFVIKKKSFADLIAIFKK